MKTTHLCLKCGEGGYALYGHVILINGSCTVIGLIMSPVLWYSDTMLCSHVTRNFEIIFKFTLFLRLYNIRYNNMRIVL